jgi:iron-sulfur cluster repair protein YtfE (RIC family)
MNRREALQRVALLMGGAVSAPLLNAVLSGCASGTRQLEKPWSPQTLSAEQNELVTAIAEMIIPSTDTPGAQAAAVNEFIDLLLTEWYPMEERNRFMNGLNALATRFQQLHGKKFLEGTAEQQAALLTELDNEAIAARRRGEQDVPFFGMMKEMTLVGYYTSAIGMTEEHEFQPATDRFEGCIPLGRVGKTWAELMN